MITGLDYADVAEEMELCEACVHGKLHRASFLSGGGKRAELPLELVHSDVCGKMNSKSLSGAQYFVTFIDEDQTHLDLHPETKE